MKSGSIFGNKDEEAVNYDITDKMQFDPDSCTKIQDTASAMHTDLYDF